MARDTALLNDILLRCSKGAVRLFRNSVGRGWCGRETKFQNAQTVTVFPGDVLIRNARPLHAGLATGSADLIGLQSVTITPDMIGRTLAVFVSLEAKQGAGRLSREQKDWGEMVRQMGGVSVVVRCVEDAESRLKENA